MEVGVTDVAVQLGVSPRRARSLIEVGCIPARRVSGRWLIDETRLPRSTALSRPMSPRVAWALISILSGHPPTGLSQPEQSRLMAKYRRLLTAPDRAAVLRSWLPARAQLHRFSVADSDLAELLADPRLVPCGISDTLAGLSTSSEAEAYVQPGDLDGLVADYLMSDLGRLNVWLRVTDHHVPRPPPLGLVIADLADHDGRREDAQLEHLLEPRP
jgi:hypothetical protein